MQILRAGLDGRADVGVLLQDGVQNHQELPEEVEASEGVGDAGMEDHKDEASEAFLFLVKVLNVGLVDLALEIAEEVAPASLRGGVVLNYGFKLGTELLRKIKIKMAPLSMKTKRTGF